MPLARKLRRAPTALPPAPRTVSLVVNSGGCARGCGNELSQSISPLTFRTKKFVSVAVAPKGNKGVRQKRTVMRVLRCRAPRKLPARDVYCCPTPTTAVNGYLLGCSRLHGDMCRCQCVLGNTRPGQSNRRTQDSRRHVEYPLENRPGRYHRSTRRPEPALRRKTNKNGPGSFPRPFFPLLADKNARVNMDRMRQPLAAERAGSSRFRGSEPKSSHVPKQSLGTWRNRGIHLEPNSKTPRGSLLPGKGHDAAHLGDLQLQRIPL